MNESRRQLLVTTSVFVGAMILFGPLTFAILVAAADAAVRGVGVTGGLSGIAESVVQIAAVLAAGEVVAEITAIQLYGFGALNRGSRRERLARHGLLGLVVVAATGLLVGFLAQVVYYDGLSTDTTAVAMAGLVALALLWATGRTVLAFRRGYAGDGIGD